MARTQKTYRGSRIKFTLMLVFVLALAMSCIRSGSDGNAGTYAATKEAEARALAKSQLGKQAPAQPKVAIYPAYPFSGGTRTPVTVYTGTEDDLVGNGGKGSLGGPRQNTEDTDQGTNTGIGSTLLGPSGGTLSDSGTSNNGGDSSGRDDDSSSTSGTTTSPGIRPANPGGGSGFDLGADDAGLGAGGNNGTRGRGGNSNSSSSGSNIQRNPAAEQVVVAFIKSYTTYDAGKISADQFAASVQGVAEDTRREIRDQAKANWPRLSQDKVVSTGTIKGSPRQISDSVWEVEVDLDERGTKTSKQRTVKYTITTTKQGGKDLVHSVTS